MNDNPQVLIPFIQGEGITVNQATGIACRSRETIQNWCEAHSEVSI